MKTKKRYTVAKVVWGTILIGLVLIIVGGGIIFSKVVREVPDPRSIILKPSGRMDSYVLNDQGEKIDVFTNQGNSIYVTLEEIPETLQHAIITVEDKRFYGHNGVDGKSLLGALRSNVQTGSLSRGGSTITEQLIKNNVTLSNGGIIDKFKRLYLSYAIEKFYTKDELLECYLNTIIFGQGTVGVESAAKRYFGKEMSELDEIECMVLAVIPSRPTYYNPITKPENNWLAVQSCIDEMVKLGYLTEDEQVVLLTKNPYENIKKVQQAYTDNQSTSGHSYFIDALYDQVTKDLEEIYGYSHEKAVGMLLSGGLIIHSTLNSEAEMIINTYMSNSSLYPENNKGIEAAFVLADYKTGQVKALYGGRGEKAPMGFNQAIDAKRQPGSTLKILSAYAPAINEGKLTIDTLTTDEAVQVEIGSGIPYVVRNWNGQYQGKISVRQAIYESLNTVPAKIIKEEIGTELAFSYLQNFGLSLMEEDKAPSLIVGALKEGISALELNAAYGTIANGGMYKAPSFYTTVVSSEGEVLLDRTKKEERKVLEKGTCEQLAIALEEVITKGSGKSIEALMEGEVIAGKTGTSQDNKDMVFSGYTKDYVATIWMMQDESKGDSTYYLKLWGEMMKEISK